jgi:segregation and condensation protein B
MNRRCRTLAASLTAMRAGGQPVGVLLASLPQAEARGRPAAKTRWAFPDARPAGFGPGRQPAPAAAGQHVRSEELARLEAALFLAREPLTTRRLAKLARLADGTRARSLLRELRRLQDAAGSAIRVEPIAGGFQLLTRAAFGPWIRRLQDHPSVAKMSAAGLETLAIVAYRQPVTRAEIEAIRGVGSEEMLRQLLERDLVAIGGRAEELGRPNVYVTTRRFLEAFGLARLEELPAIESLAAAAEGDPERAGDGSDEPES